MNNFLKETAMADLYQQHIAEKTTRFQIILEKLGLDEIVIGSGSGKIQFQDDMAYPYKVIHTFENGYHLSLIHI